MLAGEMVQAAGETIVHRMEMMRRAAGDPVVLGHPEFALMYREKGEAGLAAARAMADDVIDGQRVMASWLGDQARLNMSALLSLARCRSLPDWLAVQRRYLEASTERAATAGSRLAKLAGHAADAGLAPVHRAASGNARRLGRRKPGA